MKNIKVPELGESIIEGTLTSWLVKEGDSFELGDNLAEIETEKRESGREKSGRDGVNDAL